MKKTAKWIVAALAAALALLVMGCENEPDSVAVESVHLTKSTLVLGVGETGILTAYVEPLNAEDRTLTWESSNDDVVTVSEYGEITAVSVGKATITAKTDGKQATCEVTVHVHFYSEGKCTVCGAELKIEGYGIGDGGVLTYYYGKDVTVTIPETVTGIGKGAFYDNKNIESVTIPGSVKSIESRGSGYSSHGAFEGCTNLKTVTMGEGVESIGDYAFYNCTSLTSVTIPASVTSIGSGAFNGCTSLASVTIPASVTSIGSGAFNGCTSLASVTIPASVTSIGSSAFWNCTSLMEIQFEGTKEQWNAIEGSKWVNVTCIQCSNGHIGVKEVPEYLTMSGTNVTGYTGTVPAVLVIPDGVKSIGREAFKGCSILHVTIPASVKSIGDSAFSGCTSLASVTIPDSVTSIGKSAFEGCTSLASVTYKGTLAQWCAMSNDSSLMSNAKTVTLDGMPNLKAVTKLTIPEGVESIGDSAFYYCTNLTEVEIPNTVKSIGSSAFYGCKSLASVTIPASVTSIEFWAFSWCTSLESVKIGDGMESIGYGAFYGCKTLTEIEIPGSVTSIEFWAFEGCTSLATVNYDGTEEQWKAITKNSYYGLSGMTITGKDGKTWKA